MRWPIGTGQAFRTVFEASAFVLHHREQFPIGQGGFHAGHLLNQCHWEFASSGLQLSAGPPYFSYVYDCGSEPRYRVDRAIEEFISARRQHKLNIFFLSHFDRDHMCGTPRLLDLRHGLPVDTIVVPYVDDVERLIDFGRHGRAKVDADGFFENMIIDPIATLNRFEPRQIILIVGDGDVPPIGGDPTERPIGGGEGEEWKIVDRGTGGAARGWRSGHGNAVFVNDVSIDVFGTPAAGAWRLIPYVHRADAGRVLEFTRVAERLLGWRAGTFRRRVKDVAIRRELVTRHRGKMSAAYKAAFKDKNSTSLCLYSGPALPYLVEAVQIQPRLPFAPIARIGWMGTGDADLKNPASIAAFASHYRDELDYISTFMFPHHGSIHNSDPSVLISNADQWVAAAKPNHKNWKHPAKALRKAVKARGQIFRHVGDTKRSKLSEFVIACWN